MGNNLKGAALVQPLIASAITNTVVLVAEYATFCTTVNLDFSQTDDVKAYVVRELDGSEQLIHMERVKNVPAGTGIMLVGTPGEYTPPDSRRS